MKKGDLVRITYRTLIYPTRWGGNCIGPIDPDEVVLVVDNNEKWHGVKILHPVYGFGFIVRSYAEVIS